MVPVLKVVEQGNSSGTDQGRTLKPKGWKSTKKSQESLSQSVAMENCSWHKEPLLGDIYKRRNISKMRKPTVLDSASSLV